MTDMTEAHDDTIVETLDDMDSNFKNIRLMDDHLVADPIDPRECEIKDGVATDLLICNGEDDVTSCCPCIKANENGSVPFEIGKRFKEAIFGDIYTGFKLELTQNSSQQNIYKRGEMVVIKVISIYKIDQFKRRSKRCVEDPYKEVALLQMFKGKSKNVSDQIECIRDENYIYSIMKHYGEELFNYAGKLSEVKCQNYFRQIINGVRIMQTMNVCHRDLTLENVLVSPDGVCTIIDFGMSLIYPTAKESFIKAMYNKLTTKTEYACTEEDDVGDEEQIILMPPQGTCGKKNYIAPEILSNDQPFNGAMVDNWSLGVILFMLLTGRPPFHKASMLDKWYRMIQNNKLREMLSVWKVEGISDTSIDLLQILLKGSNHKLRMKADDILLHPWFQSIPSDASDDSVTR
jgi:serine/threonine protein kinase